MNPSLELGEKFSAGLGRYKQPMFLLAHHDDEVNAAGLLQRLGPKTKIVWVTNSDGLYFESDMSPTNYGGMRMAEGVVSVGNVGIPENSTRCLAYSEVEIYRYLADLHCGRKQVNQALPLFRKMLDDVKKAIFDIEPDVVFTLAWQGGQPEHDLTHFFGRLALDEYQAKTGRKVEYFHSPAYEYTILLAARFNPFYGGTKMRIKLTPQELENKKRIIEAYPSQKRLFADFTKVFKVFGLLGKLTGGPASIEEYLSIEEFGPVPEGLDYTKNTHMFDFLTYMFDDFEGTPVTFSKSIQPIVKGLLG